MQNIVSQQMTGETFCFASLPEKNTTGKKEEFEALKTIESRGIPAPKPIAFGRCPDNSSVYMLLSWTEGKEAEEVLPLLSREEQYRVGVKAGILQKRLNSIPAPGGMKPWDLRFGKKNSTGKTRGILPAASVSSMTI